MAPLTPYIERIVLTEIIQFLTMDNFADKNDNKMCPYVVFQSHADFAMASESSKYQPFLFSNMQQPLIDKVAKRALATQCEKKRQEKINEQINTLRQMVLPKVLKQPTKATVLRKTVDRLKYLEELHVRLKNKETQVKSESKLLARIKGEVAKSTQPLFTIQQRVEGYGALGLNAHDLTFMQQLNDNHF